MVQPFGGAGPARVTWRLVAGVFAAWTVYALFREQYVATVGGDPFGGRISRSGEYGFFLRAAWQWALFTLALVPVDAAIRRRRSWAVTAGAHLATFTLVHVLDVLLDMAHARALMGGPRGPFASIEAALVVQSHLNILMYLLVIALVRSRQTSIESRERALALARVSAHASAARLHVLQAQVHPHFLFNTLASLSELVHKDAAAAEHLVVRLAAYLRRTLDAAERYEQSLGAERDSVVDYLEIQRVRFGRRLAYRLEIPERLLPALVPTLILQPLVENSVRHGLGGQVEPGNIIVRAEESGESLVVTVSDDGRGLGDSPRAREGLGLRITRQRLAEMFGKAGSLEIGPAEPKGTIVRLRMPLRPVGAEAIVGDPVVTPDAAELGPAGAHGTAGATAAGV